MRLIDADVLIGKLRKWGVPSDAWVIDEIKQAQTIDAVPVIHCKDCKYWNGSGKYCDYEMRGLENDFCSWAERKEE